MKKEFDRFGKNCCCPSDDIPACDAFKRGDVVFQTKTKSVQRSPVVPPPRLFMT